jgi:argininosuccinate lyase
VRACEAERRDLNKLTLADLRTYSRLFDEDALRIDVISSLRSRDVPGGTAPRQVAAALRRARKRLARASTGAAGRTGPAPARSRK